MMNIEEERKAFEALYKPCDRIAFCFGLKKYVQLSMEDNDSEIVDHANQCWELWQAAKAQAVPEGFVLVNAEQLNQWGHMANAAEQYGCCECFESRGYAHNLACEISSYFEPTVEQEQSNESN